MSKQSKQFCRSTSPKENSPAAEIIASNMDLLIEILVRLPAKPLIKFKCVSKNWLSLICNPQFGINHTRRNPTPTASGVYLNFVFPISVAGRRGGTSLPTLSFLDVAMPGSSCSSVSHSSNGLLLCCNGDRSYTICNLTTQKFIALPKPSVTLPEGYSTEQPYLFFDPTKSPYYKVVLVCSDRSFRRNDTQLAIYASECASWKTVSLAPSIKDYERGAIWKGGIIWRTCLRDEHVYSRLDVDMEKLTVTRVPPDPGLTKWIIYFGECGGRLLMIQHPLVNEFSVLDMDTDDFRWAVRYRVDITSLILPNRSTCVISVISVVKGAQENDFAVVFFNRGKLFSSNLQCGTMKVLCELSPSEISSFARGRELYKCSYQFIESLSPV